jgi:hypothetical protein
MIAREEPHQPDDRSQGAAVRDGACRRRYDTFEFLASWMRTLCRRGSSFAIHDLCKRYSVDLAALSRSSSMDWDDLAKLAADPLATIGSATVNYPALSNLKEVDAQREMTMGKAVAETALHRTVRPFRLSVRRPESWRRAHVVMGQEAGFASAVSDDPRRRRGQGIYQSARAAADRLGRTAAFAAHDARDAVG